MCALSVSPPPHSAPPLPLWGFRVRLSEGFHFACSGEGIINMVLELPIQVSAVPHDTSYQGLSSQGHLPLSQVGTTGNCLTGSLWPQELRPETRPRTVW